MCQIRADLGDLIFMYLSETERGRESLYVCVCVIHLVDDESLSLLLMECVFWLQNMLKYMLHGSMSPFFDSLQQKNLFLSVYLWDAIVINQS